MQPGEVGLARAQAVAAGGDDVQSCPSPSSRGGRARSWMRSTSIVPGQSRVAELLDAAVGDPRAGDVVEPPAARDVGGRGGVDALGQDAVVAAAEDGDVADLADGDGVGRQADDVVAAAQPVVAAGLALGRAVAIVADAPQAQLAGRVRQREIVDRELDRRPGPRPAGSSIQRIVERAHAAAPDDDQLAVAQQVGDREQAGDQRRDRHQLGEHDRQPQAEIAHARGEGPRASAPARGRRRSGRSRWRSR